MRTSDDPITIGKIQMLNEDICHARMRGEPKDHLLILSDYISKECFFADKLRDEQALKEKNT